MNNTSILFAILIILLVISVISPGCLQEKETGQLPATTPPTEVSDNSSVNVTSTEPTITATTTYPSEQFGVSIFKDSDSICVGQDLRFGLFNKGQSAIRFSMGNPFMIEIYENGTWQTLYGGGGTQAFWHLNPIRREDWYIQGVQLYDNYSYDPVNFIPRPGLYRIRFSGVNVDTNESFRVGTEFTMHGCEQS